MGAVTDEVFLRETINMEIIVDFDNKKKRQKSIHGRDSGRGKKKKKEVETVTKEKCFGKIFYKVKNEVVVAGGS